MFRLCSMRFWGRLQGLEAAHAWELMRPRAPLLNQKEPLSGRAIEAVPFEEEAPVPTPQELEQKFWKALNQT
jgi:hypothetical protein